VRDRDSVTRGITMRSTDRRGLIVGGTAFVASCLCRGAGARASDAPPRRFDTIAYCGLDCEKCDAYLATVKKDAALQAEVAARWRMKPEQIECMGCKSATPLFNCTLKKCASKRGVPTCAHCTDFTTCSDEQWKRFPKLREAAEALRATLG
jgi:hypothetical protein